MIAHRRLVQIQLISAAFAAGIGIVSMAANRDWVWGGLAIGWAAMTDHHRRELQRTKLEE